MKRSGKGEGHGERSRGEGLQTKRSGKGEGHGERSMGEGLQVKRSGKGEGHGERSRGGGAPDEAQLEGGRERSHVEEWHQGIKLT